MMERLPRDIQIEIIKRLDMDARIALGLVGRIRVPQCVIDMIGAIQRPIKKQHCDELKLGVTHGQYFWSHASKWRFMVSSCLGDRLNLEEMYSSDDRVAWHRVRVKWGGGVWL